jgi:hypothetical protein
MSYKEWNAVVSIAGGVVISAWVLLDALGNPPAGVADAAARLLWAILYVIIFNIVVIIIVTILVSIARREEFKDERDDERDIAINARGMRNGFVIASLAGLACLFVLAFGYDPTAAAYALFGGLMLAGIADAASRLVYYRIG